MASTDLLPGQQLENAFLAFSRVSRQLSESYNQLQERVRQLSCELAAARGERMRQLTEKERFAHRFAQLLDALPAAVVVLDGQDRVEQFNPTAQALFEPLAVGTPWTRISRQFRYSGQCNDECTLASGRVVTLTERNLAPEPGRILLLLDITETRLLQQCAERERRLSAMGEMAAQLAHQVRTPLSSALLYTTHLARDDLTADQRRKFYQRSRGRLLHMERQIDDMLTFAKGGEYRLHPVDLNRLLAELMQTLKPIAKERRIGLDFSAVDGEAMIAGDQVALLGAIMNIATNALEHSAAGGVISLGLRLAGDEWKLTVQDQGPGVPEAIHAQIFDPFFTTRSAGTGLGLAVTQAVALGHKGRVEVTDSPFGGASFCLTLPRLAARWLDHSGHARTAVVDTATKTVTGAPHE